MARLHAIASVQASHILLDAPGVEEIFGADRASRIYALRSILDSGARACFGTDWPVAGLNPLDGVYAAVTRLSLDGSYPWGWFPEQRVSLQEALRCYTFQRN